MALIDANSFEYNSTTANIQGGDTFTSLVVGTTHVRTGSRALQSTSLSSGTPHGYNKKFQAAAQTDNYYGIGLKIITLPSASNQIINLSASTSLGASVRCSITIEADGTLILRDNAGTAIGSASAAINDSTYHYVELRCNTKPALGSRVIEGRVDGSVFATASNKSQGTASSYSIGNNLASEAQTVGEWWFDDVILTDDTTSFMNTYPGGTVKVAQVLASAAGDANGFLVQVGGTAGSSNNYTRTNENPPDGATSYNASAVLNAEDLFVVDVSAIPTTATINAFAVGERCANLVAGDATTAIKLELMKASGGTKAQSADIIPNSTSFNTNGTSSPRLLQLIKYQDPDNVNWNPATWTPQIGYIVDVVGTQSIAMTAVWGIIVYTPAAASTYKPRNLTLLGVGS